MNTNDDAWTKLYNQLSDQEKQEYAAFSRKYQEIRTKQAEGQELTTDESVCIKNSPQQSWVFKKIEQLLESGLTTEGQVTKFLKYNNAMVEHGIPNLAGSGINPLTLTAEQMRAAMEALQNLTETPETGFGSKGHG